MKRTFLLLYFLAALLTATVLCGCNSDSPASAETGKVNEIISWEKNAAANEEYAPRITKTNTGVMIQKVPSDKTALDVQAGDVRSKTVSCWNNYFLNADNRGCTACHTIEDALESMETYHGIIYFGYNVEQGLQNCFGCHSFYDNRMRDAIHTLHNRSEVFDNMDGSCESCHYIDTTSDGSAVYKRWDYVKYDVMRGFEDISADAAKLSLEWNQTEVTSHEQMYYKSVKSDPKDWIVSQDQTSETEFENWEISFTGALDKECTMTLKELIEKYGTETRLMKSHCTVNGPGQGMIYQAEVGYSGSKDHGGSRSPQ